MGQSPRSPHADLTAASTAASPRSTASTSTRPAAEERGAAIRDPKSVFDSLPALTLPKGGGAIRAIGEKFGVDPATGTASFSIPLPFSPGRGGAAPDLSLTYDSGAGAGVFGWGWRLALPEIARRTDRGLPRFLNDDQPDTFILSGAEDLVALLKSDGTPETIPHPTFVIHRYAPRTEGAFARIERWVHGQSGETHWRVISAANVTTLFGPTAATRIADPENTSRVFSWLVAEIFDDSGNRTVFEYKPENRDRIPVGEAHEASRRDWTNPQRHLKRIKYGNVRPKGMAGDDRFLFELVLDYGDHPGQRPTRDETALWAIRPDPISVRRATFEVRTYRLCERVLMFHRFPNGRDEDAKLVRSLAFEYRRSPVASLVTGARVAAYAETSAGRIVTEELPPLGFEYQLPPLELDPAPQALDPQDLDELPAGLADTGVQWIDIDGDGLAGALIEDHDRWAFKPNLSPLDLRPDGTATARLGGVRTLPALPAGGTAAGGRFVDVEGDGLPDLVYLDGAAPGFAGREDDGAWIARRPFHALPNVDWSSPDLRFLDLTGDGLADVVIAADDRLLWYPALGRVGYGEPRTSRLESDEEQGPHLVFRDAEETIFLADMSGDGLTDLVRIRAREVAYWPNLGYGRFGAKVTMSSAPHLGAGAVFDPQRVRLADTDGSGTTDLVYLGATGWSVHVNCAGNTFAPPLTWSSAPPFHALAQVDVFDLLGNGTACVVWSNRLPSGAGRHIRYLPLAGGRKPYLLTAVGNGLGRETQVHYVPSTAFQLRDRMAGKPWATRLPFPVQVVERVETRDRISGHRFTSHYAYHHGCYDGHEREFRGFGFVEQWDTESWTETPRDGAPNEAEPSQVPPVRTRRWFHTGMPAPGAGMSQRYERDFFGGPGQADAGASDRDLFRRTRIADADIPPGLPAPDHRNVCRALKGSLLREEVYADDRTGRARLPYKVSVAGYAVQVRQAAGARHPTVVFVHPRETLDVHLERDLTTPRVAQSFVLRVGRFGDVLQRVELFHGGPAPAFESPGVTAVTLPRAFLDETDVTAHVDQPDAWRKPLPAETRRFALAGAALQTPWPMARSTIGDLVEDATPLTPTDTSDAAANPCGKRLLARSRTLYRRDDLSRPLAFLELQSRAIAYETYALAATPALLARTYGDRLPAGAALAEAGYVDLEHDGSLWAPSGRAYFQRTKNHPEHAATPADQEARAAAERTAA
ncbi:MAG: toxin, partial [Chloroflexota bacterium]|nr:toxin [Chloroflexota bacterium]